jgi:hypothetical protein
MNFSKYYILTESVLRVDVKQIDEWISRNGKELLEKINDTKFESYIEEPIKLNNPYTAKNEEIKIDIKPKLFGREEVIYGRYIKDDNRVELYSTAFRGSNAKKMKDLRMMLIHELTHALDPNPLKNKENYKTNEQYFNHPYEFNAYASQFIDKLKNMKVDKEKIKKLDFGEKEINSWFHKLLTADNKKKFIKYVYQHILGA